VRQFNDRQSSARRDRRSFAGTRAWTGLTKRNHSNPCFWTAYWDTTYYESRVAGRDPETEARRTPVFALNVKANKIIPTVVDDVHFDKGMGQDTISPEAMRGFCKRALSRSV